MTSHPQRPIYAAIPVPTSAAHAEVTCLQWSADGQLILATRNAVYVLTPDPGIGIGRISPVQNPVQISDKAHPEHKPLPTFRTMIELDRGVIHHWPVMEVNWAAVSLGSLDVSLRSVTCSPSGLTSGARCILAILTSNLELSIWHAKKNHLSGEWSKLQDVTAALKEKRATLPSSPLVNILQVQITCIAWSAQCRFDTSPGLLLDVSLLAGANKAGEIMLLRRSQYLGSGGDEDIRMEIIDHLAVSDVWCSSVVWSPWSSINGDTAVAYLACARTDGSISILTVQQKLARARGVFGDDYSISVDCTKVPIGVVVSDARKILAMALISGTSGLPILVFCKSGTVHFWSKTAENTGWTEKRTVRLKNQQLHMDSSALHPTSAIIYVEERDAVVVTLLDGSFHTINNISVDPTLDLVLDSDTFSTDQISIQARLIFAITEQNHRKPSSYISHKDANRIYGAISYDDGPTLAWLHEQTRPSDFSYKHDAKHTSTLVIAQMWDPLEEDRQLERLKHTLNNPPADLGLAPIAALRPHLAFLRIRNRVASLAEKLLTVLYPLSSQPLQVEAPTFEGEQTLALRLAFRRILSRSQFGSDELLSLRLRRAIAQFCLQQLPDSSILKPQYEQLLSSIDTTLFNSSLHIVLAHITAVKSTLSEADDPFLGRLLAQSLLQDCPPEFSARAQQLSSRFDISSSNAIVNTSIEACPACQSPVSFEVMTQAKCNNGHSWGRCSITSFILSTPFVRTCIGCNRKAFLPVSGSPRKDNAHLPAVARSWIVEELLEATNRCIFCGNTFVSLI